MVRQTRGQIVVEIVNCFLLYLPQQIHNAQKLGEKILK